jgi:hypothetical protein
MRSSAVFTYQFGNPRLAMDLVTGVGILTIFPPSRNYDPDIYLHLSSYTKQASALTFDVSAFAAYQAQPDVTSVERQSAIGKLFRSADNISQITGRPPAVRPSLVILSAPSSTKMILPRPRIV